MDKKQVIIIGAGLAGLMAARTLAKQGIASALVSVLPSERAQSVLAEGGINAALDAMGEGDSTEQHFADTLRAGGNIADPAAVRGLTEHAPEVVAFLESIGVPFQMEAGHISQRSFGGQKKRRTAYARSSTGKAAMTAMIDEVRRWEAAGLVTRYPHHEFLSLLLSENGDCAGAFVYDTFRREVLCLRGEVLLACGGMNGIFPGLTTGTTANTGDTAAAVFQQGAALGNLEMIQYHPTTFAIPGKRCLISEAARGEGARLYILRGGEKWHFMEEKYPELGNLMPRDVISREMTLVVQDPGCGGQVFLDMTELPEKIWRERLPDLRSEIQLWLGIDPKKVPVPVEPGIHYFMGGIAVDVSHRTSVPGLHAAGECCCQYHGANRLGGNSMLGALYGGLTAAEDIAGGSFTPGGRADGEKAAQAAREYIPPVSDAFAERLGKLLAESLGILRTGPQMEAALEKISALAAEAGNRREKNRLCLARAMVLSGLARQESRGAHCRRDFPQRDNSYTGLTRAAYSGGHISVTLERTGGAHEGNS